MFKRVLFCYEGSDAGRRALRRGAELAILLNAHAHVLLIIPSGIHDPFLVAGATGHACIVDDATAGGDTAAAKPANTVPGYRYRRLKRFVAALLQPGISRRCWSSNPLE